MSFFHRLAVSLTVAGLLGCEPQADSLPGVVDQQDDAIWTDLFAGGLKNWMSISGGSVGDEWQFDGGVVMLSAAGGGDILTRQLYEDFELQIEWKISEGGNSGIFWGVVEDPDLSEPYYTGPEVQILDIDKAKYDSSREKEDEFYQPGALYDLSRPSEQVAKPAGMWNHVVIHINHEKNHGHVVLNSVKIHEFPINGVQWEKMIAGSKFKDWSKFGTYKTGKIGLQDHGNPVAFKNIKIKNLR